MRPGHDYVVVGRRAALTLDFDRLIGDLAQSLTRLHDKSIAAHGTHAAASSDSKDTP